MWAQYVETHLVYSDERTVGSQKGNRVPTAADNCLLARNREIDIYSFPTFINGRKPRHGDAI